MAELIYIGTRVDGEVKNLVNKVCEGRGMSIADFIRGLVRRELAEHNYLDDETKQAFGLEG